MRCLADKEEDEQDDRHGALASSAEPPLQACLQTAGERTNHLECDELIDWNMLYILQLAFDEAYDREDEDGKQGECDGRALL